jgi:hypothetical protein
MSNEGGDMAKKPARSKSSGSSKKAKAGKPAVKKTARPAKKAAPRRAPSARPRAKVKPAARVPAPPKENTLRDKMLAQISALALTLEDNSLKKLLQDAAILAHNERVLRDFIVGKDKPAPQTHSVLAAVEEGKDGTYFIVILKGYRHIFGLEEMRNLVKTCYAATTAAEAGPRLFAWFERERRDIIMNSKIADQRDTCLSALREVIVSTYASGD